ncbi:MAG TPA: carboxypeptidase-like regulatory domain-containing protein [Thermoanaerobaculia bacterium]
MRKLIWIAFLLACGASSLSADETVRARRALVEDAVAVTEPGNELGEFVSRMSARAARVFSLAQPGSREEAVRLVDAAVAKVAAAELSPRRKTPLLESLSILRATVTEAEAPASGTLTVRVLRPAGDGSATSASAGGGVYVAMDGVDVGETVNDGTLVIKAPAGRTVRITATVYPSESGDAHTQVQANENGVVDVFLQDGKEATAGSALIIDQLEEDTLPWDLEALTMRFDEFGATAALQAIESADLTDSAGNVTVIPDGTLAIKADGTIYATNLRFIRNYLDHHDEATLEIHGYDEALRNHNGSVTFKVSRVQLGGVVSNASSTGETYVAAKLLGSDQVFHTKADATGHFTFEQLPQGTYDVVVEGGQHVLATQRVKASKRNVEVRMRARETE